MDRRKVLKLGLYAGGIGALGAGGAIWRGVPRGPGEDLGDVRAIAADFYVSLDDKARKSVVFDYDHPLRQYHNRGVWASGQMVGAQNFSRYQLGLINDLFHAGLSPGGRERVTEQFFIDWPGVLMLDLKVFGNPEGGDYLVMFAGPHVNLRVGGANREGVAFGGPQVYGDQHGNNKPGLPGNVYRHQLDAASNIFSKLTEEQRTQALIDASPIQTQIEVQGAAGNFDGVSVASLGADAKASVRALIDLMLEPYPVNDVAYANTCLKANGGIENMALAWYRDSAHDEAGPFQTFRLEGPAAVFYYRGFPHLHAFINVAMDGQTPLSVGDVLGHNPSLLEGARLKTFFEKAMATEAQTDFGFYNSDSVVGKLAAGIVRSGDIYNAESWINRAVQVTSKGSNITGELRAGLEAQGVALESERLYTVATTDYLVKDSPQLAFANVDDFLETDMLRDIIVRYLRQHGFA